MKTRTWVPWMGFVTLVMAACSSDEVSHRQGPARAAEDPAPRATWSSAPAALRSAYIATVEGSAAEGYRVERAGGAARATNAAHGLRVDFSAQKVEVTPAPGAGSWAFELAPSRWGCEGRLAEVQRAAPEIQGNRVDYPHEGLRERYLNGPLGLEQGFTLAQAPCASGERGSVVIELGGGGGLRAEISPQGDAARLHEAGGAEVLRYSDLYVVDAAGRQLDARLEDSASGLAIRIDDAGAVYPIDVDPLVWTQQQELLASDGAPEDDFGTAVAISGSTAVVGANGNALDQGAAYVFVQTGTVWTQQQELVASDGALGDLFGNSVAISASTVVVGAPGKAVGQGAAYVFVRTGTTWAQQQELVASDGAVTDLFGVSVAIDVDTAVVGAPGNTLDQGAAYVFVRTGTTWAQQQELVAGDGAAFDELGSAVAVDVDTAVVGAPDKNLVQGAAYVFVRTGTTWAQQQELVAGDGAANDGFGSAVAVNVDTAVAGAPGKALNQGGAYVFARTGTTWAQQQELVAGDGVASDALGSSVAVEGNTAVVGAPGKATAQGAAYVFARTGITWTQQQELLAGDGEAGDFFGSSVAIDGSTAVVGAPFRASYQGGAYVFVNASSGGAPNGSPCALPTDCASDFCADGVCCNTACNAGACEACSVAAGAPSDGTCAPLTGPVCDDGDACTQTDTCQAGTCVGSNPIVCTASDGCHEAGTCAPATGLCSNPTAPDGTACIDSGSACPDDATCEAGVCTPDVLTPTCVTIQRTGASGSVADALIADDGGTDGSTTRNYGSSNSLSVGLVGTGQRQSLIRFDLSAIPSSATITSATLTLSVLLDPGAPVRIHRATVPWSEATVTWASFEEAFAPTVEATLPGTSTPSASLTALVQAWVSGSFANDGILLERDLTGFTVFASSEYTQSQRPELAVCYTACF
jgi:uncharacterized protein (DUF2345 family)